MSYTRDPDHYTRGVGAVQAVDKVLAHNRGRARRLNDAAIESARRDRQKAKLMRPGLGAVKLPNFGRTGVSMAPVVTSGGVVEGGGTIGGGGAVNTGGGMFGSGGGGGGVAPGNGVKGRTFTIAQNAAQTGVFVPTTNTGYAVSGICVDANGNKIACPPPATGGGRSWNGNTGIVPPVFKPRGGSGKGGVPPASNTDPVPVPTSTVGASSGGSSSSSGGGGGGSSGGASGGGASSPPYADPTDSVDTDSTVLVPTGPDYKKYAMYGGAALGLFLLYRSFNKKDG